MRRLKIDELKNMSNYQFECNMTEEFKDCGNYDEWGCAFVWLDNIGVEYNFCIDGDNCSAIYRMEWCKKENYMHTDYSCNYHYEIDFNDNDWKLKLENEMCQALIHMYMLTVDKEQKVINYFDTICNILNKSFQYERDNIGNYICDGFPNFIIQDILIDLCDKVTNKQNTYINKGEKIMSTVTREQVVKGLNEAGYSVKLVDVTKNGVHKKGFELVTENVMNPVVYVNDTDLKEKTLEQIVKQLIDIFEQEKSPKINPDIFKDINYIIKNIRIGVQRCSNENILKQNVDELKGIESYLYINVSLGNEEGTAKLPKDFPKNIDVDETYLWELAKLNTFKDVTIKSILETMCEISEIKYDPTLEVVMNPMRMYVLTNANSFRGAAGVLNENLLKRFAKEQKVNKLILIPSSIHEILIVPYNEDDNVTLEDITSMVKEVNGTQVMPEEQLSDMAYIYEVE